MLIVCLRLFPLYNIDVESPSWCSPKRQLSISVSVPVIMSAIRLRPSADIMSTLCLRPLANLALNDTLNLPQHLLLNTNGFIIVYRKDNRHLPSSELGENGTIMDCRLFRLQVYFTLRRDEFASANFMRVCLH